MKLVMISDRNVAIVILMNAGGGVTERGKMNGFHPGLFATHLLLRPEHNYLLSQLSIITQENAWFCMYEFKKMLGNVCSCMKTLVCE